jgi:DNA gyrase subunit A
MGEESEVAADQPQQEELPEESFEENGMGGAAETSISEEQFAYYAEREEFVLSVTEKGFGVRSSAYDYRITRRGGLGIENVALRANDAVIDAFPVGRNDQVILVTDTGMVIRVPVHDIRIVRRGKQGVVVFKVGDGERVVSVAHLPESDENGSGGNGSDASPADAPDTNET